MYFPVLNMYKLMWGDPIFMTSLKVNYFYCQRRLASVSIAGLFDSK